MDVPSIMGPFRNGLTFFGLIKSIDFKMYFHPIKPAIVLAKHSSNQLMKTITRMRYIKSFLVHKRKHVLRTLGTIFPN